MTIIFWLLATAFIIYMPLSNDAEKKSSMHAEKKDLKISENNLQVCLSLCRQLILSIFLQPF